MRTARKPPHKRQKQDQRRDRQKREANRRVLHRGGKVPKIRDLENGSADDVFFMHGTRVRRSVRIALCLKVQRAVLAALHADHAVRRGERFAQSERDHVAFPDRFGIGGFHENQAADGIFRFHRPRQHGVDPKDRDACADEKQRGKHNECGQNRGQYVPSFPHRRSFFRENQVKTEITKKDIFIRASEKQIYLLKLLMYDNKQFFGQSVSQRLSSISSRRQKIASVGIPSTMLTCRSHLHCT